MDLTAREVHEKQFNDEWRGYNREQVDDFLDQVAETIDRLHRENSALHNRVQELDQAVATSRETEDMLKKTLITAQKAAEEALASAKAKADQLVREAQEQSQRASEGARELLAQAESEARRKTMEAERESAGRRRDVDATIERLRAYEGDLKQRLRSFLEQQLKLLDQLSDRPTAQTTGPRPVEAQARPPLRPEPAEAHLQHAPEGGREGQQPRSPGVGERHEEAPGPQGQRRIRSFFRGEDE